MKCNVGETERTLRLTGAAAIGMFAPLGRTGRAFAFGIGVAELITAWARYGPLNAALGINTCEPATRLAREAKEIV